MDLHDARREIADALVNGKDIEMAGCKKAAEGWRPMCSPADCGSISFRPFTNV